MNIVSLASRQTCSNKKRTEKSEKKKECTTLASGLEVETKNKIKNEHCQPGKQTNMFEKKENTVEKSEKTKKRMHNLGERIGG